MIWRRKKKQDVIQPKPVEKALRPPVDFTVELDDPEEKEIVSVIASIIASENHANSSFRIKSVKGVDHDKEAVAVIVAAVMANDRPESTMKLISIKERRIEC